MNGESDDMSEDHIRELYKRTDEHGRAITELTAEQRVMASQIVAHERRFDRIMRDSAESRAEILAKLDANQQRTEQALEGRWKASGAWELIYKGLPIVIALGALVAAVKWS